MNRLNSLSQLAQALQIPLALWQTQSLNHWSQTGSRSVSNPVNDYSGAEHQVIPGALRGYRVWRFQEDLLMAANWPLFWLPGKYTALCTRILAPHAHGSEEPSPVKDCTCGIYARHRPEDVNVTLGPIMGTIKAYGHVILGTEGFRAQYAEIEAISAPWGGLYTQGTMDYLSHKYEVPAFPSYQRLVEAFPPIPVGELLPEPLPTSEQFPELLKALAEALSRVPPSYE